LGHEVLQVLSNTFEPKTGESGEDVMDYGPIRGVIVGRASVLA
jgi:hypothetical protein